MTTTEFYEIDCDDLDFPNLMKEHPTATMIKNIDMKKEFIKVRKNRHTLFNFQNLFGIDVSREQGKICPRPYQKPTCSKCILNNNPVWKERTIKNGIEIIGLKPLIKTTRMFNDGGWGTKDLKTACKKNGLKGYSNKKKMELVKMLMSI